MLSPVFRPDAEVLEILCAFGRCDMREAINGALRWESDAIIMTLHRSFNVSSVPASQGSVEAGACPILSFGLQVFLRRYQGLSALALRLATTFGISRLRHKLGALRQRVRESLDCDGRCEMRVE